MAETIRNAARCSVGSVMPAKSLKLQHTIRLIRELDSEIGDIEAAIQTMMEEIASPITTIPGIGVRMGAMILAEIGDFSRFDSPDKILAYAGMSPSTYQSGQMSLTGSYSQWVHPLLKIPPVDRSYTIPFGLLHSPSPTDTVKRFLQTMQQAGIDTEFHVYPGLGHGFGLGTGTAAERQLNDAAAFLETQMD